MRVPGPDARQEVLQRWTQVIADLTLPDGEHSPAKLLKLGKDALISFGVLEELPLPELWSAFRYICVLASRMAMPEAPVNKYDRPVFWKNDIWFARQGRHVEPKPVPHPMQQGSHDQFRLRIPGTNPGHVPTAFLFAQTVHSRLDNSTP